MKSSARNGRGHGPVPRLPRRPLPAASQSRSRRTTSRRCSKSSSDIVAARATRSTDSEQFGYFERRGEASLGKRSRELGREHGYRNAQVTVLAPTGTIGFLMDCDTTGIEPDIALVKYKLLAGGGMLKIVNQTVRPALHKLGYSAEEIERIIAHIDRFDTIEDVTESDGSHDFLRTEAGARLGVRLRLPARQAASARSHYAATSA